MTRYKVILDAPELYLGEHNWIEDLIKNVLSDVGMTVVEITEA